MPNASRPGYASRTNRISMRHSAPEYHSRQENLHRPEAAMPGKDCSGKGDEPNSDNAR